MPKKRGPEAADVVAGSDLVEGFRALAETKLELASAKEVRMLRSEELAKSHSEPAPYYQDRALIPGGIALKYGIDSIVAQSQVRTAEQRVAEHEATLIKNREELDELIDRVVGRAVIATVVEGGNRGIWYSHYVRSDGRLRKVYVSAAAGDIIQGEEYPDFGELILRGGELRDSTSTTTAKDKLWVAPVSVVDQRAIPQVTLEFKD